MKIKSLAVQNVLGISAVTIEPKYPIVLIGAPNGAGKTSLYQAMRLALFDELPRVDFKRDANELVRGGAAKGAIAVSLDLGATVQPITLSLPDRKRDFGPLNGITSFCLAPSMFAKLDPADRAKLVLDLSGVSMTKEAIAKRLQAHAVPQGVINELDPLLILGFEKCALHAKEQATEHRGAWKQITGETYGAVKAAKWTPEKAAELPSAPADMDKAIADHAKAVQAQSKLENLRAVYDDHAAKRASDEVLAPKVAALQEKVHELQKTVDADVAPEYPACPECGTLLRINPAPPTLTKYVKPDTTAPTVTAAVRAKAKRELNAATAELIAAQAAAARLTETFDAKRPTDDELTVAKDAVAQAADFLSGLRRQQDAYAVAAQARQVAEKRHNNAQTEHLWVKGWELAEVALGPAGIPSELSAQAMAPMRSAITAVCASDSIKDWPLPELADDGGISAWGRPYQLLSESEQYRVDAILTAALARVSKIRMIAMDRADVLSPQVRSELIAWLGDMSDDGVLEQAWIFATLRTEPNRAQLAAVDVDGYWIENGALRE